MLGKSIDLSKWYGHEIVLDTNSQVHCVLGYRSENEPHDIPYRPPCVAALDRDGRSSFGFIELRRGVLCRTHFFKDDDYYRVLEDRLLVLPIGSNSYFGVISRDDRSEDESLTRCIFGGTYREIEAVAVAFANIAGRTYDEGIHPPKLTFSKSRNNRCDLTGCLIPREFPYIAFEAAQCDWSHLSLYGFYRILSFLCRSAGLVAQALLKSGITEETISRMVENGKDPFPLKALEYV